MPARSLPALVDALIALPPGSAAAEQLQHGIESLLMAALRRGGREAGETLLESLAAHGHELDRLDTLPCLWRVKIPPPRVLEIWFTGGEMPLVAALSYRVGKPWGSKAQKRAAALQAEFYRRYEGIGFDDTTLPADDRIIRLVGELEADVNNGGFGQYIANKGEARAREALACLRTIGAKQTAGWLTSALEGDDAESLTRLDQKFDEGPEDLAVKVMAYLGRKK
jgi:hypothetical protein